MSCSVFPSFPCMGQNYPPRFLKQPGGGQHSPATGSKPIRPKTSVPDSPRLPAIIRPAPPSRSQRHAAMGSNSTRTAADNTGQHRSRLPTGPATDNTGPGAPNAPARQFPSHPPGQHRPASATASNRPAPRKKTLTLCDNFRLSLFSPALFPLFSVCLGPVFVLFGFSLFSVHGAELPTTVFETARRRTAPPGQPRHRLPFDPHRRGQPRAAPASTGQHRPRLPPRPPRGKNAHSL